MVRKKFNPGYFSQDVRTRLEIARHLKILVNDPEDEVWSMVLDRLP